jgi:hypothetical protein
MSEGTAIWERRRPAGKAFRINAAVITRSCRRDAGAPRHKPLQSCPDSHFRLHPDFPHGCFRGCPDNRMADEPFGIGIAIAIGSYILSKNRCRCRFRFRPKPEDPDFHSSSGAPRPMRDCFEYSFSRFPFPVSSWVHCIGYGCGFNCKSAIGNRQSIFMRHRVRRGCNCLSIKTYFCEYRCRALW